MIWESHDWKDELARELRTLKRRMRKGVSPGTEDVPEQVLIAIEKFAFTSAFIVRKLADAHKVSDELEGTMLPVQVFHRVNSERQVDFMNWHHIERFYDLGDARHEEVSPRELCNILIHSFVFSPVVDRGTSQVRAILFNSDRTKDEKLFCMNVDDLLRFMRSVIKDDIVSFDFDRRTGILRKSDC